MKTVGEIVKNYRTKKKFSLQRFAVHIRKITGTKININCIYKIESNKYGVIPKIFTLETLSKATGISLLKLKRLAYKQEIKRCQLNLKKKYFNDTDKKNT